MFFFFQMGIFLKACAFKQLAGRCAFPSSCAVVLWFDAGLWSFCCTFKNSFILLRLTCTNGTTEKTTIMHGPMWPNDTDPFPVVVKKCCEICCSKPANFKRNIKQKTLDPRGSTPKWIEQKKLWMLQWCSWLLFVLQALRTDARLFFASEEFEGHGNEQGVAKCPWEILKCSEPQGRAERDKRHSWSVAQRRYNLLTRSCSFVVAPVYQHPPWPRTHKCKETNVALQFAELVHPQNKSNFHGLATLTLIREFARKWTPEMTQIAVAWRGIVFNRASCEQTSLPGCSSSVLVFCRLPPAKLTWRFFFVIQASK